MQNRQHKGHAALRAQNAADDIRALVAVEVIVQHLDTHIVRPQLEAGQIGKLAVERGQNAADIPFQILVGHTQSVIDQQFMQRLLQTAERSSRTLVRTSRVVVHARRMIIHTIAAQHRAAVGRRQITPGRPHERVLVAQLPVLKHGVEDRVIEGLGDLEITVLANQPRVHHARRAPEVVILKRFAGDELHRAQHRFELELVEVETPRGGLVDAGPVGVFEARARAQGDVLKLGKIRLEAVEDNARKALAALHSAARGGQASARGCRSAAATCAYRSASDRSPRFYAADTWPLQGGAKSENAHPPGPAPPPPPRPAR